MKARAAPACLVLLAWFIGVPVVLADPLRLDVASTFSNTMPVLGDVSRRLSEVISHATDGDVTLTFYEPGKLAPAAETADAVATGIVEAAWAGAGWFAGKDSAFNLFSSVPFGPGMSEYLAWLYRGGGLEMAREMFHRYGVHNIPCGVMPPEAAGWFQKEIKTVQDLRGLRMRIVGLGAGVMEKHGVIAQDIPEGEILDAMKAGTLDAAEFQLPAIDRQVGLDKVAKYYYFPGWHQQATLFDLYVNKVIWDGLPERQRAVIEIACGDAMREMIADGEALEWKAMKEMQAEGVHLRRWPLEVLVSFENAWKDVVAEESARNPNFKRVYDSYAEFRENYTIWRNFNFLN